MALTQIDPDVFSITREPPSEELKFRNYAELRPRKIGIFILGTILDRVFPIVFIVANLKQM